MIVTRARRLARRQNPRTNSKSQPQLQSHHNGVCPTKVAIAKWRVGSRNLVSDKEQPQVLLKVLFDEGRDFALRADSANLFDLLAVLE